MGGDFCSCKRIYMKHTSYILSTEGYLVGSAWSYDTLCESSATDFETRAEVEVIVEDDATV